MKKLKLFAMLCIALFLLAMACKKDEPEDNIPYGEELITEEGKCECETFMFDTLYDYEIHLYSSNFVDSIKDKARPFLTFNKDSLRLGWSPTAPPMWYGTICNTPKSLEEFELPFDGLKVKVNAEFYYLCSDDQTIFFYPPSNIILTSLIILKP